MKLTLLFSTMLLLNSCILAMEVSEPSSLKINFQEVEKMTESGKPLQLTATLEKDGKIRIYDSNTGNFITELEDTYNPSEVLSFNFSRSGTSLYIDTRTKGSISQSLSYLRK